MIRKLPFVVCCLLPAVAVCGCGKTAEETASKPDANRKQTVPQPTVKGPQMLSVVPDPIPDKIAGHEVTQYILRNRNGVIVKLINWGATVTSVQTPDRDGKPGEIVLAYKDLKQYGENKSYFGCIVGRYANRIAGGRFTIDGKEYRLTTNDGSKKQNLLHGGAEGFNRRLWLAEPIEEKDAVGVKFTLTSPDGDQGFPGELTVHVTYTLNNDDELLLEYEAIASEATHVNLSNHCYWNLAGGGDVLGHELMLNCDRFLPVDAELIPTGELKEVKGTPWNFTSPETIGARIEDERLGKPGQKGRGYDHCYVIREGIAEKRHGVPLAARVHDPKSGRVLEVYTDQPGIQLYTGNFLDGSPDSGGFSRHGAFCLECQRFPDTPHHESFPTTLLRPGEVYRQVTVHRFSVKK